MARTFTIELTTSPEVVLAKATAAAAEAGATFTGDTSSGHFDGKGVVGDYQISGTTVTVTVTSKPWYAPMSMVESKIRAFFS